jgi:hypothetical protein
LNKSPVSITRNEGQDLVHFGRVVLREYAAKVVSDEALNLRISVIVLYEPPGYDIVKHLFFLGFFLRTILLASF